MCKECGCGWNESQEGLIRRRILTREERVEKLRNYAEELRRELSAVEERIRELTLKA